MPAKNLGVNLLQYFAIGGLWSIGYLAYPMLVDAGSVDTAIQMRQLMLLLAVPAMLFVAIIRLKTVAWQITDVLAQLGVAIAAFGAVAFVANIQGNQQMMGFFYGLASLAAVGWVAWQKPPAQD
ncbi:hypothetical protein [Salinibius halmophilus]|uniref:hypothetical protein n=1 Tax=Salinibius halmophilus TaxID=1853216 RepID=UPI000E65F6A6|nr:hypothetical protein [Salinibius halmophilus]